MRLRHHGYENRVWHGFIPNLNFISQAHLGDSASFLRFIIKLLYFNILKQQTISFMGFQHRWKFEYNIYFEILHISNIHLTCWVKQFTKHFKEQRRPLLFIPDLYQFLITVNLIVSILWWASNEYSNDKLILS